LQRRSICSDGQLTKNDDDLKTLSQYNSILKYADDHDTSILVPQHSSVSKEEEFQNVQISSATKKLQINTR